MTNQTDREREKITQTGTETALLNGIFQSSIDCLILPTSVCSHKRKQHAAGIGLCAASTDSCMVTLSRVIMTQTEAS